MIRVERQPEPEDFDALVRQPGLAWLARSNNAQRNRPCDFWNECRAAVEAQFSSRCGYVAIWIHDGQVDHFVSVAQCRRNDTHPLVYEWSNLRWLCSAMNQRKSDRSGLLDPFEVGDSWFELDLPSLNLRLTDSVPSAARERAEATFECLDLIRGHTVMKLRTHYLEVYRSGADRGFLFAHAPLLMLAIDRLMSEPDEVLSPIRLAFKHDLQAARGERAAST